MTGASHLPRSKDLRDGNLTTLHRFIKQLNFPQGQTICKVRTDLSPRNDHSKERNTVNGVGTKRRGEGGALRASD